VAHLAGGPKTAKSPRLAPPAGGGHFAFDHIVPLAGCSQHQKQKGIGSKADAPVIEPESGYAATV